MDHVSTDDAPDLSTPKWEAKFAKVKVSRGRPALPEEQKKKRINIMLDPDVADALKADGGNTSARINALLRKDLRL